MYEDAAMDPTSHTMNMYDVGLSSMWAADAQFLARIADEIGQTQDAVTLRQEAVNISNQINTLLWNSDLGIYCNRFWTPQPKYELVPTACLTAADGS